MIIKNNTEKPMSYFIGTKEQIDNFFVNHKSPFTGISGYLGIGREVNLKEEIKKDYVIKLVKG